MFAIRTFSLFVLFEIHYVDTIWIQSYLDLRAKRAVENCIIICTDMLFVLFRNLKIMQFRHHDNLYFSRKQKIILFGRNIIWMTTRSARAKKTILFVQSCYLYFFIFINSDYFDKDVICTFYNLKMMTISTSSNYSDVFLLYMPLRGGRIVLYPR